MHDIKSNIKITDHLPANTYASSTVANGAISSIDLSGFTNLSFLVSAGTVGTSLDVKIQHSDDNVSFSDTGISMTQLTAAGNVQLDVPVPLKRYIKCVATLGGTCIFSITAIVGGARHLPVS